MNARKEYADRSRKTGEIDLILWDGQREYKQSMGNNEGPTFLHVLSLLTALSTGNNDGPAFLHFGFAHLFLV